jgi:uncharacterized membrane protein
LTYGSAVFSLTATSRTSHKALIFGMDNKFSAIEYELARRMHLLIRHTTLGVFAMRNSERVFRLAISSMLAAGAIATGSSAFAAPPGMEQCAGVIKAGKNDCATSSNACHSHVTVDNNPEAWIYLPTGTCERISGAHLVQVTDPTPAKK